MSTPYTLSLVKTTQSYTAEFVGNTADPCYTKGLMESSPSIYFNGISFFFNYSQSKNVNDLKFLKVFLKGLTTGSTFAFSSGKYANIETGAVTSFDGILTLQGITGEYNQYFYASGVTWTNGLSAGYYDKKLFTKPIQYTATTGVTCSYLISRTPEPDPLNFGYMGIYGLDYGFLEYLEVEGSSLNSGRLKIKNCIKLNDNSEIIYLDSSEYIVNESFYFKKPFINLYMRGSMPLDIINYDETVNGVVRITTPAPGIYSHLLENQNRQQYALRTSTVSETSLYWYPNLKLKSFSEMIPSNNDFYSYPYNTIYHLYVRSVQVPVVAAANMLEPPTLLSNDYYNICYIDNVATTSIINSVIQSTGSIFKIDLSDSRNIDLQVSAFTDADCTVPLLENYVLFGTPGKMGAAFVYYPGQNTIYNSLYLKLSRESEIILTITLA